MAKLLSVIIGHIDPDTNVWGVGKDDYGNSFIRNEYLRQNIRLGGKKMNPDDVKFLYSSSNSTAFELPSNTFISNNIKNMNLVLMNFWSKDPEIREHHCDDNICYITLMNENYKLISYDTFSNDIVQTYRRKQEYQGCAFTFKHLDCKLFSIYAKDIKKNRFVEILVSVDAEAHTHVNVSIIDDNDTIKILSSKLKRMKRDVHFKMTSNSGKLLTSAYITTPEHINAVIELTKDIKDPIIIATEDLSLSSEEFNVLDESRIRAVTTVGVKIPRDFIKNHRLLYLFSFDLESGELRCIKSN